MESARSIKGQATIPKAIREHLKLEPGDKFFVHPDGTVLILPKLPVSALKGVISPRKRSPASIAEMEMAAAEGAVGGRRRPKRR